MGSRIHIDFETRSLLSLGEDDDEGVGSWAYSLHPSTEVLCVAVAFNDDEPRVYDANEISTIPFTIGVEDTIHTFNASFEYAIWTNVLKSWPVPRIDQWRDVQAKCCANGLPAGLGRAGKALRLKQLKDPTGAQHIKFFCEPYNDEGLFRQPELNTYEFRQLKEYCAQDVRAQQAIDKALPDLIQSEEDFWLETFKTNIRGICVDRDLCQLLIDLKKAGEAELESEVLALTNGEISQADFNSHARITSWVRDRGVFIDGVGKVDLQNAFKKDMPSDVRRLLQIRQLMSKSSLAKLPSILRDSGQDSRVRFTLRYHGAATGRDTSKGIQIQNIPRGEKGIKPEEAINKLKVEGVDAILKEYPGRALEVAVSCLRGVFCAGPRKVITQCDYAAIEPRIAAWLFEEREMLSAFYAFDKGLGPDIYQLFAASYYEEPDPYQIKGDRRGFGKVAELQLLYQSGPDKFRATARDVYKLNVTQDMAEKAVQLYRNSRHRIRQGWGDLQSAAHLAVHSPGKVYVTGKIAFKFDGRHLYMRLPSGRKICYPWARVEKRPTEFGPRDTLVHMGMVEKKWMEVTQYGGSLTNNAVQGSGADLLRYAAINAAKKGYEIVLRVHDELNAEVPIDAVDPLTNFKSIMLDLPIWAKGIPVNGAGWVGKRYRKD